MSETLTALVIILALASLAALASRSLGMGTILGLLIAGIVAGPHGLGLASNIETLRHWSEIGVALLLFAIGLELHPARLWKMRRNVFGLGATQVILTSAILSSIVWVVTRDWRFAVLAGTGLSLSSTAMILQTLKERNEFEETHGKVAFSILLFQDMAIVPITALVPLLALSVDQWNGSALPSQLGYMIASILLILAVGHWILPRLLRIAMRHNSRDAFHGLLLATVLGSAMLSEHAGLSMALGAFLLGLILFCRRGNVYRIAGSALTVAPTSIGGARDFDPQSTGIVRTGSPQRAEHQNRTTHCLLSSAMRRVRFCVICKGSIFRLAPSKSTNPAHFAHLTHHAGYPVSHPIGRSTAMNPLQKWGKPQRQYHCSHPA